MFVANYIIVDWGLYGMWLSNCSDDINSTMWDYVTQVTWKITNCSMEHFHDKGLLGWLDGGMAPPRPQIVLKKQMGPEQWDIWKLQMMAQNRNTDQQNRIEDPEINQFTYSQLFYNKGGKNIE